MRHEGNHWNAYYAMPGTMDGAILLGSICMAAIVESPARKTAFMDMMRDVVGEVVAAKTGSQVSWPEGAKPAPEHERAGHA